MHEESGLDSSSPSGDMLTCSRPLIERRLRPPHDQALKCPRCDSTHTKFCYYNNYSLSQPRYFCKTCRRYWTKGGTLRNIPVGGGCRKNKKVVSKKPNDQSANSPSIINQNSIINNIPGSSSSTTSNPTDLQLSFPDQVHFSHLGNLLGPGLGNPASFMEANNKPIEFMESKLEAIVGNSRNYDFMGSGHGDHWNIGHQHHHQHHGLEQNNNFHGFCSPFGMSMDANNGSFMDTCERIMLPYDQGAADQHDKRLMLPYNQHHEDQNAVDVKPNTKLLSLDWQQDQGCSDAGKESFGYLNGLTSWTNVMNNYGPSTTNPLV